MEPSGSSIPDAEQQVAAHLVNLAYTGLSYLETRPQLIGRMPHRSTGQPTSRAPGTGPCTARTVRNKPTPARVAASFTAASS